MNFFVFGTEHFAEIALKVFTVAPFNAAPHQSSVLLCKSNLYLKSACFSLEPGITHVNIL